MDKTTGSSNGKLSKNTKVLILIIIVLFACCGLPTIIATISEQSLPPQIQPVVPTELISASETPTIDLKLHCSGTSKITVNGQNLASEDIYSLCNNQGYNITLADGTNKVAIKAENQRGETDNLEFNIKFNQKEYLTKIQDQKKTKEAEKNKPKVGDVLSGIGITEIKTKFKEQNDLSNYKGTVYLDSLKGKQVIWVGKVGEVKDYWIGKGHYISLTLSDDLFNLDSAAVDVVKEEDLNLNINTVIKVSGTISRVDDSGMWGLTPYINNVNIEIIK